MYKLRYSKVDPVHSMKFCVYVCVCGGGCWNSSTDS
jgi:hypothetical protein